MAQRAAHLLAFFIHEACGATITSVLIAALVAGCASGPSRVAHAPATFRSLTEARANLPHGCAMGPFLLDGRALSDSGAVYALADSEIESVSLVFATERGSCPAISVRTKTQR